MRSNYCLKDYIEPNEVSVDLTPTPPRRRGSLSVYLLTYYLKNRLTFALHGSQTTHHSQFAIYYSLLKLSTGFAIAAFIAW